MGPFTFDFARLIGSFHACLLLKNQQKFVLQRTPCVKHYLLRPCDLQSMSRKKFLFRTKLRPVRILHEQTLACWFLSIKTLYCHGYGFCFSVCGSHEDFFQDEFTIQPRIVNKGCAAACDALARDATLAHNKHCPGFVPFYHNLSQRPEICVLLLFITG